MVPSLEAGVLNSPAVSVSLVFCSGKLSRSRIPVHMYRMMVRYAPQKPSPLHTSDVKFSHICLSLPTVCTHQVPSFNCLCIDDIRSSVYTHVCMDFFASSLLLVTARIFGTLGGLDTNKIRNYGEVFRVFWSMNLHGGWIHLIVNLTCQVQLLWIIEPVRRTERLPAYAEVSRGRGSMCLLPHKHLLFPSQCYYASVDAFLALRTSRLSISSLPSSLS